ncbi:MAG: hypothetical protein ACREUE_04240 [Panacagrimonas sp.]
MQNAVSLLVVVLAGLAGMSSAREAPPGAPHFAGFAEDSVVQVTGRGPWGVEWVSP